MAEATAEAGMAAAAWEVEMVAGMAAAGMEEVVQGAVRVVVVRVEEVQEGERVEGEKAVEGTG